MLKVSISRACLDHFRTATKRKGLTAKEVASYLVELLFDETGALNPKTTTARRNAALDAAFDSGLNSGFLRIYDQTQPTDADTALGAQVKLAEPVVQTGR
jgi:hypothetical protein